MKRQEVLIPTGEVQRQMEICRQLAQHNAKAGGQPLALVDTYGCQQNEADSEQIRGMLREMGYAFTEDTSVADVIVINTCAIREHAELRVLGNVGALTHTKRRKPNQVICLCGCSMQEPHMAEKIRKSFRHVDLVFGPHALWRFPELLQQVLLKKERVFATEQSDGRIAEGLPVVRRGKIKAWVSIMYGCNNFCTYCIVPYVLVRFMTSHPKDASQKLFETMARCDKVAPQLHLPVQSGSSRVLKAMNRHYDREIYLDEVRRLKALIPDIVLTSDIIVGFPGETQEEFEETLSLLEEVRFDSLFTFIFSPRVGTPAAKMDDPVPMEEKKKWFQRLLDTQNRISVEKHKEYIGRILPVLVEEENPADAVNNLNCRTDGWRLVNVPGDVSLLGQRKKVKITDCSTWSLFGEFVEE